MRQGYRVLLLMLAAGVLAAAGCREAGRTAAAPEAAPLASEHTRYPLTLKDDLGVSVSLARRPMRLLSLAPSLTEALFACGLGDRVVGVTNFCNYPPEARKKPRIGGYVDSSEEKIVSLSPDLVFCTRGTPTTFISGLRATGLTVFAFDEVSFADITRALETIGTLCDVRPEANRVADGLRDDLEKLRTRTGALADDARPRALFVVWLDPLFVAGPGSFQDEIMSAAGGRNVSGVSKPFANLSPEAAVAADPQVLLLSSEHSGQTGDATAQLAALRKHPVWKNLSAVKTGRVVVLDAGHVAVPGPRLTKGMTDILRGLHPELAGGAQP